MKPGERIALAGENGAGKSTLVKLLMGLYKPTEGKITVDGMDLSDLSPRDWQRRFGVVFQDFIRFETTVRENVSLEILVLDEPASALDAKAETDVYEHFAHMGAGKTVILISHRLGSCQLADRVLVFKDGCLVEHGDHQTLMASQGEYADMYEQQAAWYR